MAGLLLCWGVWGVVDLRRCVAGSPVLGGRVLVVGVQVSAARRWWPLVIRSVQGHRRGRRRMRRRPVVMMRPATASSRSRRRLGSQRAGGLVGPGQQLGPGEQFGGQLDQFEPDLVLGERLQRQVGHPGVLETADAVLGACPQSVAHLQVGQPPAAVLVANTVIRQPSASVMRSWAPGWGRSRRAMIRIPGGQPVKVAGSHRVSSAT